MIILKLDCEMVSKS